MSAAAQRRTPLELVPDAAAPPEDNGWLTEPVQDQDLDWRATSVIDQWTPEHQLIGALMWLTAEQARPILELVPDTAIWRPMHPMGLRDHPRRGRRRPRPQPGAGAVHRRPAALEPGRGRPNHAARHPHATTSWPCTWPRPTPRCSHPRPPPVTTRARSSTRPTGEHPRQRHPHAATGRLWRRTRRPHRPIRQDPRRAGRPVAPRRNGRQARVVAAMMRTDPLEATVAGHAIRHLAGLAYTQPGRAAAPAAAALIDALHTRAQQRAERRLRSDTALSVRPRTLNAG